MEIIANEVLYVENLFKNQKLTPRRVTKDIRLVVQYYLSKGMDETITLRNVVEFVNEVNGDKSGERWSKEIKGIIKDLNKKKDFTMRKIDKVTISKKEIEAISKLKTKNQKKYAWGLLLVCKIVNHEKTSQWVTINHTTKFCKMFEINVSSAEKREKIFHELVEKGYIRISCRVGSNSMELLFVDGECEDGVEIPTLNALTNEEIYFQNGNVLFNSLFNGGKSYECLVCKTQTPTKTKVKKYCPHCAEDVKRGRIKIEKQLKMLEK